MCSCRGQWACCDVIVNNDEDSWLKSGSCVNRITEWSERKKKKTKSKNWLAKEHYKEIFVGIDCSRPMWTMRMETNKKAGSIEIENDYYYYYYCFCCCCCWCWYCVLCCRNPIKCPCRFVLFFELCKHAHWIRISFAILHTILQCEKERKISHSCYQQHIGDKRFDVP